MGLAVSLRSLMVLLGGFPALSGVDLDVSPGEIVCIRGANGAGKTTLLRFCAGLLNHRQGQGQVLGFDIGGADSYSRRLWRAQVGYLGHETRLYADLTARQNLEFLACLHGVAVASTVSAVAQRLELSDELLRTRAGDLSAGQRRRVALAAVVSRRPRLWLLDEPHASLDARSRDGVNQLMSDAARAGAALVVVSHEAEAMAGVDGVTRSVELAGGATVAVPTVAVPDVAASESRS